MSDRDNNPQANNDLFISINSSFLHATHIVHHLEMEYNYFKDKYLYENKFTYVIP